MRDDDTKSESDITDKLNDLLSLDEREHLLERGPIIANDIDGTRPSNLTAENLALARDIYSSGSSDDDNLEYQFKERQDPPGKEWMHTFSFFIEVWDTIREEFYIHPLPAGEELPDHLIEKDIYIKSLEDTIAGKGEGSETVVGKYTRRYVADKQKEKDLKREKD